MASSIAAPLTSPLAPIVAGWTAYLITVTICKIAAASKLLPDRPNARSSHENVTSKAGGVAIMVGWFAGMLVLTAFWASGDEIIFAARLTLLAALAFLLGLADDRWALAAPMKFAGQILLAGLFVLVFGAFETLPVPFGGEAALGGFGIALTILWIVGFMNIFNFMDGANGLAAGSAILGLIVFAIASGLSGSIFPALIAILLAAGAFGFFLNNFKHGKIFMGDSGSQSVSFLIAALAVIASKQAQFSLLFVPTMFLPLIFDAAFTLVHRLARGRNVLRAHREHLYQLLLRQGRDHRDVAALYCAFTGFAAAAALIQLALPAAWQWLPPLVLCLALLAWALPVFRRAKAAGLFEDVDGERVEA